MPGILFVLNPSENLLQGALMQLQDIGYHVKQISLRVKDCFVANYAYERYPFHVYRKGDQIILMEGMVYSNEVLQADHLFEQFFSTDGFQHERIAQWVEKADGEFLFLLFDLKLQQALFVNDRFGRLPVYVVQKGRSVALSREIRFARMIMESADSDPVASAQNLLFGFALGDRTLWKGVKRFSPFAQFQIDLINGRCKQWDYFKWPQQQAAALASDETDYLLDLFRKATSNRIQKLSNPAISLSGGLDSRLIAAVVAESEPFVPFFTYDDASGSAKSDIKAVEEILFRLEIKQRHQFIKLPEAGEKQMRELMRIKQGLNGPDMAFLIRFLKFFRNDSFTMITGDGGDKVLADLRPLVKISSQRQMLHYLLRKHAQIQPKTAAMLCGITPSELLSSIRMVLESYEANSFEEQHAQFMIRERAMKWLFEGEDRNRYFCWSTTPFYHPGFFDLAMGLSMREKAFGKVFLSMFQQLKGKLEDVNNPNWNTPLSSQKDIEKVYAKQKLYYTLPVFVINNLKKRNSTVMEIDDFIFGFQLRKALSEESEKMNLHKTLSMKLSSETWFRVLGLVDVM